MFNIVLAEPENIIAERKISKASYSYANAMFASAVGSRDLSLKRIGSYV